MRVLASELIRSWDIWLLIALLGLLLGSFTAVRNRAYSMKQLEQQNQQIQRSLDRIETQIGTRK